MDELIEVVPLAGNLTTTTLFFPALLSSIVYSDKTEADDHPPNRLDLYEEYDFIVVGAGSAGAVVASRLSEMEDYTVLLIEAGGDETAISDIPKLVPTLRMTEMDWQYRTQPEEGACLSEPEKSCEWTCGKALGGTSALNYMIYMRGNKRDYDGWEAAGNPGWAYKDVLTYFKRSENQQNPSYASDTLYHSTGGPLTVGDVPWQTIMAPVFLEAAQERGYEVRDLNSHSQTGFMRLQATMRNGSRCSTSKAFLRPVGNRPNLHIAKYTLATKVLMDPNTRSAYAVELYRNGENMSARARKEIILSAGALNTPQLLMLSGIGPKDHLDSLGIPVIGNLPVGNNLQNHVGVSIMFTLEENLLKLDQRPENNFQGLAYSLYGTGPLTLLGDAEVTGLVNTKYSTDSDFPDVQLTFNYGCWGGVGEPVPNSSNDMANEASSFHKDCINIMPVVSRPRSIGSVRLSSADPFSKPLLYANFFSDVENNDANVLVEGAKIALDLIKTKAFQKFGAKHVPQPTPECESFNISTDAFLHCLIRHRTLNIKHQAGTTKMGSYSDSSAVVDSDLRVHGIRRLRVVDASIMPTVVSGNTNAAVIMIGEKGADIIKTYWAGQSPEDIPKPEEQSGATCCPHYGYSTFILTVTTLLLIMKTSI